jgi:hypothetical protein
MPANFKTLGWVKLRMFYLLDAGRKGRHTARHNQDSSCRLPGLAHETSASTSAAICSGPLSTLQGQSILPDDYDWERDQD